MSDNPHFDTLSALILAGDLSSKQLEQIASQMAFGRFRFLELSQLTLEPMKSIVSADSPVASMNDQANSDKSEIRMACHGIVGKQ